MYSTFNKLGLRIPHGINIYRRYSHWSRTNCIYIHVPKVAGTSISNALYGKPLGHYSAAEISRRFPVLFDTALSFSFVRNPWDRILSAYRFARIGGTEAMGMKNPGKYRTSEFSSFERFLYEWLSFRNPENEDFIFKPQCYFLCDLEGEVMVDYLGRYERFKEDLKIIEGEIGRTLEVHYSNETSSYEDYRKQYTSPEMIELVADKYSRDVKIFEYEF